MQGLALCSFVIPFFVTICLFPLALHAPPYFYLTIVNQIESGGF